MSYNPDQKRGDTINRGRWTAYEHSTPDTTLASPPGVSATRAWLELNGRYLPDDAVAVFTERIAANPGANKSELFSALYRERNGYSESDFQDYHTALDALRRTGYAAEADGLERYVAGVSGQPASGASVADAQGTIPVSDAELDAMGVPDALHVTDPEVQAGKVFDTVISDNTVFYRSRPKVYPNYPEKFRFQSSRPITDDEVQQVAGLIGYAARTEIRGEGFGDPVRDSPYSFIMDTDTTKSRSDDIGHALTRWEEALPRLLADGSPVRTTDRAGAGTRGTRLIDGFGVDTPDLELYYDDVHIDHD